MKEKDFPYYLPSRKEKFVARTKELQDINETFKNSQTQIICICSFSGKRLNILDFIKSIFYFSNM